MLMRPVTNKQDFNLRSASVSYLYKQLINAQTLSICYVGYFIQVKRPTSDKINWMKPTFLFLEVLKILSVWCRGAHFATAKEKANLKELQKGTLRAEMKASNWKEPRDCSKRVKRQRSRRDNYEKLKTPWNPASHQSKASKEIHSLTSLFFSLVCFSLS